jgi:hypothetical protein
MTAVPRAAAQAPGAPPAAQAPIVRTYPQRQRDPGITTTQRAVPVPPRYSARDDHDHHDGGHNNYYYVPPPRRYYNYNYYYYPRYSYPYGYGGFGLGYFYYDPYAWGPYYNPYYYGGGYSAGGYYGGGGGGGTYYATGELRLEVRPRSAQVFVDGYFAGHVDDFDGAFQSLSLEEGPHSIRIEEPGYPPLEFSVRIFAGRKMTYRADLIQPRP